MYVLVRQKIWLNKSDYVFKQVEVLDFNVNVVVDVKFDSFKFGVEFSKDVFDMQCNMIVGIKGNSGIDIMNLVEQVGENGIKELVSFEIVLG